MNEGNPIEITKTRGGLSGLKKVTLYVLQKGFKLTKFLLGLFGVMLLAALDVKRGREEESYYEKSSRMQLDDVYNHNLYHGEDIYDNDNLN